MLIQLIQAWRTTARAAERDDASQRAVGGRPAAAPAATAAAAAAQSAEDEVRLRYLYFHHFVITRGASARAYLGWEKYSERAILI